MDRFQKISVFVLIVLSITVGFEFIQVKAIPAPSINSTCEPGGCGSDACTYMFYIDGSTYLAKNCKTGGNDYSGTNPTTVFNNAITAGGAGHYHFRGGPFVFTSQITVSTAGLTIICDSKQGTILRMDPSFPVSTSLLLVNADRFTIHDCEFDGNNVAGSMGLQTGTVNGPHAFNAFWNFNAEDLLFVNFKSNIGALNVQGYYYVWIKTVEITACFNAMFLSNLAFYHLIADYLHDNTVGLNTQAGDGEILGGTYYNNTQYGILVGANAAPFLSDLTIDGISSSVNGLNGIKMGYGQIIIANSWIFDNGWNTAASNAERSGVQFLSSQNCQVNHSQLRGINKNTQTYGAIEVSGAFNAQTNYFAFDNFGGNAVNPISLVSANSLVVSSLNYNNILTPYSQTAGASVWTYTNNDNVYEQIQLTTVAGLTSWTCRGITMSNTVQTYGPLLAPTQTCAVTWATTAPVFEIYRQG